MIGPDTGSFSAMTESFDNWPEFGQSNSSLRHFLLLNADLRKA